MAEESEGKIREALKYLDQEAKELDFRRTGLVAFLNTRQANRELEKQKAGLYDEIAELVAKIKADTDAWTKEKQERQAAWDKERVEHEQAHAVSRETDQKELAGLKASITKAKTQAADAEKDAKKKIEAANKTLAEVLAGNEAIVEDLNKQIQEKKDKIAALDEEFRSIAQRHGLGAALDESAKSA